MGKVKGFGNNRLLRQEHLPRFHSSKGGKKKTPATNPTLDEIFKLKTTKVVKQSEKTSHSPWRGFLHKIKDWRQGGDLWNDPIFPFLLTSTTAPSYRQSFQTTYLLFLCSFITILNRTPQFCFASELGSTAENLSHFPKAKNTRERIHTYTAAAEFCSIFLELSSILTVLNQSINIF